MSEDRSSDQDHIEQRLKATEERFRIAQVAGGIGWFEWDLVTDALEWTPHVAVLFGFDPQTPRPQQADWQPAIFVDDVPKLRSAVEQAGEKAPYYAEFRVTHPDGSIHWIAGKGEITRDNAGHALRVAGVYYDISERKALEAGLLALNDGLEARVADRARQLAATAARLEETERRFHLLIDAVTDYAIFMLDRTGHVVTWNPGAERIKGYASEEIIGQHFSRFYSDDDRQQGVPDRALATAERTGKYEAEGTRVRKDGSKFLASVVINAIRDPSGSLLGFAKITRDITQRKAVEDQLRQAQKMEAIGQLTGGVAHDFNNLLTVIMGNLEHLERILPPVQPTERIIAAALRGASRAAMLTQRLLAFSRRQHVRKPGAMRAGAPLLPERGATRWSLFFPDLLPHAPSAGSFSTFTIAHRNFDFSTSVGRKPSGPYAVGNCWRTNSMAACRSRKRPSSCPSSTAARISLKRGPGE